MSHDAITLPVICPECGLMTWDPQYLSGGQVVCGVCAKEANNDLDTLADEALAEHRRGETLPIATDCVCGRNGYDCPSCKSKLAGSIEPVDPADAIIIGGYFANLPRYHVDAIWRKNGRTFVDVSPAGRSAFEPPDVTVYEYKIVERNIEGADVECVQLTEVEWIDGTKERHA